MQEAALGILEYVMLHGDPGNGTLVNQGWWASIEAVRRDTHWQRKDAEGKRLKSKGKAVAVDPHDALEMASTQTVDPFDEVEARVAAGQALAAGLAAARTPREREAVLLIGEGLDQRAAADVMGVTEARVSQLLGAVRSRLLSD